MTHTATLADLRPSLADIRPDVPVELEWTTQSGVTHHRRFSNLSELVDTMHGDDGCSCTYDPESETDTASPEEISICSFASWVDDFREWSVVETDFLDDLLTLRDEKQRAHEAWEEGIVAARLAGASLRNIAESAGCSHQTVANVLADSAVT